jgi:hypothetical protein
MRSIRFAVAALAATAAIGTPPPVAASAGQADPVLVLHVRWFGVAFSPDGDHSQDKARVAYTLGRSSEVIVKIRRDDAERTLVFKDRLGQLARGDHTWVWNGKNLRGKVVRDGAYSATFVADQVAPDGRKQTRGTDLYVDTGFDVPWAPKLTSDTVYPNTAGTPADGFWMTLGSRPDEPPTALGKVVETIKDSDGHVVSSGKPFQYHPDEYDRSMPLLFRGLDADGNQLPAGAYRLRFTVWDMAGNPGGSKAVTVHVSDAPLVEATASVVVAPTASTVPTEMSAARWGGDDPPVVPCGTVVPSEVYAEAGAMSFRSSDACGGTWDRPSIATGVGSVDLTELLPPDVAPRGLTTAWVSMRGQPTADGETDTAALTIGGAYFLPGGGTATATSAAVTGESVTTTPTVSYPFEPPYSSTYTWGVRWEIRTTGVDSYDVAAVTVHVTYLTPQAP